MHGQGQGQVSLLSPCSNEVSIVQCHVECTNLHIDTSCSNRYTWFLSCNNMIDDDL